MLRFVDRVQFGPREDLGYRRPPVTVSFEDLRRRGLPEVLFVYRLLPGGVTVCGADVFAGMIEEAYGPPRTLILDPPDENGSQRCQGVSDSGTWGWVIVTPGRRSGGRMTLAPERDGQRQATIEAVTLEHGRPVTGAVLATFPVSTPPAGDRVQSGPAGTRGYRRLPVTVSYDDLRRRGLPRILFVNEHLPEGVTVCDVSVFAAMIKEAYAGDLRFVGTDEHGNDQCVGLGSTGIWEWWAARPGKPIDGERYASPYRPIRRILFGPEGKDRKRTCTVDLDGYDGHEQEADSPIMFTIRTRPVPLTSLERGDDASDPEDVAEAVDMALSWVADRNPAAAGLLRVLAFLPDEPVSLLHLLCTERRAVLPGPEAAALIGPLLGDPAADGGVRTSLGTHALITPVVGRGHQVHPLARAAIRAQLTAEESAHWRQAAQALAEAAGIPGPQEPPS